ncbi:hypothetical protein [Bosea psychrotolerans]|uniref:hypothetical protein n=1 Tax=Bosea psychrotolerans TaxID=1871628 RepID=UPI0011AFF901|nr:hypothetical protein [Bosea psychrotolerans]
MQLRFIWYHRNEGAHLWFGKKEQPDVEARSDPLRASPLCPRQLWRPMNGETPSTAPPMGLSEREAQARVKREGFKELTRDDGRTAICIVLEVLR